MELSLPQRQVHSQRASRSTQATLWAVASALVLASLSGCGIRTERDWYTLEFRDLATQRPVADTLVISPVVGFRWMPFWESPSGYDAAFTDHAGTVTLSVIHPGWIRLERGIERHEVYVSSSRSAPGRPPNIWPIRDMGRWFQMEPPSGIPPAIEMRFVRDADRRATPREPWSNEDFTERRRALEQQASP
jgi:hypothetical protein